MVEGVGRHFIRSVRTWTDTRAHNWKDRRYSRADKRLSGTQQSMVSLIVPTLCKGHQANRIVSLRKLLQKYLPDQVYANFEVVVISDGPNAAVESLVEEIGDPRISYRSTSETSGFGGLPETKLGFEMCRGEYCLRMNDDNEPYPNYLAALLGGFEQGIDFVYARVVFKDEARSFWRSHFAGMSSYILPNDKAGTIHANNVDWMNFMFRTNVARRHGDSMCRSPYGDWEFITELLAHDVPGRFIDRLIGNKC